MAFFDSALGAIIVQPERELLSANKGQAQAGKAVGASRLQVRTVCSGERDRNTTRQGRTADKQEGACRVRSLGPSLDYSKAREKCREGQVRSSAGWAARR